MVAVLLSFIGVILIASKGNLGQLQLTNLFGDTLAVFTSVIWALFWIVNIRSKVDESIKLFYSFLFGFIFTIPIVALFSSFDLPSIEGWAASVYVGVAEMGLAFFLWLKALKYSKRTDQVSQLIFLSPFISLLFIALILHESIHIATLIGLFFILAGIFLNTWYQKKQAKKNLFHLVREGEKGSK
jgi:drug/metabolite transporter (DMT)-like permease